MHRFIDKIGRTLWRRISSLERSELRSNRGAALVMVLATLSLLTISVVEFVAASRVNLHLAENQRDEVKAYFLARSGINLQLLSLAFQNELAGTEGFIGQAVERSNFQLWEFLDILLPTFSTAAISSPIGSVNLEDTGATGFGGLMGDIEFHTPEPQEGKLNLNAFAGHNIDQATLQSLCSLVAPALYDDAFSSTVDRDRELQNRFELISAIIDHIDSDTNLTVLDANCMAQPGGVGNEISRYIDLDYGPKDEPFLSVEELSVVPGISEEFMEQFRDSFTIYPVPTEFYPNLANAADFLGFLCAHVEGADSNMMPCAMPFIASQVAILALAMDGYAAFFRDKFNLIMLYTGMTPGGGQERVVDAARRGQMIAFQRADDFIRVLNLFRSQPEAAMSFLPYSDVGRRLLYGYGGISSPDFMLPPIQVTFQDGVMRQKISVEPPQIFRIRATGRFGVAERTIEAVADVRGETQLMYWREF